MGRTHEALRRAEAKFESKYSDNHVDVDVQQKLEQMNLSEEKLAKQNLSELLQSLNSLNECIRQPLLALEVDSSESFHSRMKFENKAIPILLKRKRLVLELIDSMVNDIGVKKIRSMLKHIENKSLRTKIKKPLLLLQRKNAFLKKEYDAIKKIAKDQTIVTFKTHKPNNGNSGSYPRSTTQHKKSNNKTRSLWDPGSFAILLIGILVTIWGTAIVFIHYLGLPSPAIQEYAFLVALGFFFGIALRKSRKSSKTKKG